VKVLHIFANWKWTGPAEPALGLCRRQLETGLDVTFACALPPDPDGYGLADKVREARIPAHLALKLNKHFHVMDNSSDVKKLTRYLKQEKFDIVHTHTPNDHFIGGAAAKLRSRGPRVVRTSYEGKGFPDTFRNRFLLQRITDAYIASALSAYDADQDTFDLTHVLTRKISPAVDCKAFEPGLRRESLRADLHIPPQAVCVGIVARIQRHRRFDVLLAAAARLAREVEDFRLVIIGRGTRAEDVVVRPAARLGLDRALVMTGYRYEDYPKALATLDVKVFLVPGSDGTCRAVRQAMAVGMPIIAADRGMLMEIVEHDRSGFVIDDTEENLYRTMKQLVTDPGLRERMGRAARERAVKTFSLDGYEKQVRKIYEELLDSHGR